MRPLLLLLTTLALVAAACGADDRSDAQEDDGLVAVGTEAWVSDPPTGSGGAAGGGAADHAGAGDAPVVPPASASPAPGASAVSPTMPASPAAPAAGVESPAPGPVPLSGDVEQVLDAMTLEHKIGQLFTVVVHGARADQAASENVALYGVATPAEVVATHLVGGVIYLGHGGGPTSNVEDVLGVAELSAGLQAAALGSSGIGLLIGIDQEGGPVTRLREPATVFPAARAIGDTGDVALAERVGQVIGAEARALGINWVYAPVADVNNNPGNPVIGERAFGTEPGRVTAAALATADGLRAAGVLPTFKHYPGHGDTTVDSHTALPTIDVALDELETIHLAPFEAAVAGADPARTSVMVGHLAVPALDPSGVPATLSAPIVNRLRDSFDGVVVTDAMNMGALNGFGGPGGLAVEALRAGVDVVLFPTDLPAAIDAVRAAVGTGELTESRIDASVRRILRAKLALGALDGGGAGDPSVVGSPAHAQVRAAVREACGC